MEVYDGHCDTLLKLYSGEKTDFSFTQAGKYSGFFQIFACYSEDTDSLSVITDKLYYFKKIISHINNASLAYTPCHISSIIKSGAVAGMLSLENCSCLNSDPSQLVSLYNLGVRVITLTWNGDNAFAHGCDCPTGGLTKKGRELISLADTLGIMIDVSHLNRQSFYDVLSFCKGKIFASHSSCYSINPHNRNLTDKQIKCLIERGGLICLCPNPPFISKSNCDITDFIQHILHIYKLTDGKGIGLGFDTDGTEKNCKGLKNTCDYAFLYKKLSEYLNDYDVSNIFSYNFKEFLGISS
ncbi:MAG: membrane dipeptidase [Clostridia bacterium]|nr:membrane dipeptidase [Clostridia bacterium]